MTTSFLPRFIWLTLFLCVVFCAISCKKDSDPEPTSVNGTWVGQYSTNITTAPNIAWDAMILKEGGVLEGSDRVGTYNVTGTVLIATYVRSGSTFSFHCDITENFTKLEGTWGTGTSQNNGGRMLLTKQ